MEHRISAPRPIDTVNCDAQLALDLKKCVVGCISEAAVDRDVLLIAIRKRILQPGNSVVDVASFEDAVVVRRGIGRDPAVLGWLAFQSDLCGVIAMWVCVRRSRLCRSVIRSNNLELAQ